MTDIVTRGMINNDPAMVLDAVRKGAYVNLRYNIVPCMCRIQ
jgi:hypothetical protein